LINLVFRNPSLGAKVRSIGTYFSNITALSRDVTVAIDEDIYKQVALNIQFLTKATLVRGALTHHMITKITTYSDLKELNLRVEPNPHHWNDKPTPVEKLTWKIPTDWVDYGTSDSWASASNVVLIAGVVFPELSELNISSVRRDDFDAAPRSVPHAEISPGTSVSLPKLRIFRYVGEVNSEERGGILDFVMTNKNTLTSLTTNFGFKELKQPMINFILEIVAAVPDLKSLTIPSKGRRQRWTSHKLPIWPAPTAFTPARQASGIELFEMWNVNCNFSQNIGQLFSGWTGLRVLKIGAPLYEHDEHDGRPHFDEVAPVRPLLSVLLACNIANCAQQIREFVGCLPQSLEELYIELDNFSLVCDEDEDFDPIAELPPMIFSSLMRLHTLDISGWIADIDRSTGHIPEKAIFCRRRPSSQDPGNREKKDVWVSRIDCLYQQGIADVENSTIELQGDFEGQDADEPWLGGQRSWLSQQSKHWVDGEYLLSDNDEMNDDEEDDYDDDIVADD
jgi:hypothetical protein